MLNIEKNYVEYFNTIFLKILEFLSLLLLKFGMYVHNVYYTLLHMHYSLKVSMLPIYTLSYMLPIYDGSISAGQEFWLFRVTFFKSRAFV